MLSLTLTIVHTWLIMLEPIGMRAPILTKNGRGSGFTLLFLLLCRGVDVASFLKTIPWLGEGSTVNVADASTFVVAYAIHKVFAPVRISVTLASAPLIVRYLRSKGILKVKTV